MSRLALPKGTTKGRKRSSARTLTSLFVGLTGVLGGLLTYMIVDRLYHSVDLVSNSNLISIDSLNVGDVNKQPRDRHQQQKQQQQQPSKITPTQQEPIQMQQKQQQPKEEVKQPSAAIITGLEHADPPLMEASSDTISTIRHLADSDDLAAIQPVYFLNHSQVTHKDSFSASWLQSKQDFLEMDLSKVKICEDAAFKAWNTRKHKLRMTLDYFDFSVEHMSKWWKLLDFYEHDIVFESIRSKLESYINAGQDAEYASVGEEPIVLGNTLATIAFQPYKAPQAFADQKAPRERAYNLTVVSLAATIESLRRAEMGRVVVLGSEENHATFAQASFEYLAKHLPQLTVINESSADGSNKIVKIGHIEVGFVLSRPEQLRTKAQARNMPYGALAGSREAFLLADTDPASRAQENQGLGALEGSREAFLLADTPPPARTADQDLYLQKWLGTTQDPTFWQYLYLTEPDSILTTRTSALPQIKEEIDLRSGIVAPFRLQPIPHESDIRGYPLADRFLPEADWPVMELDHTSNDHAGDGHRHRDVCCDEHAGQEHRPGKSDFPECGSKKWFLCGFETKVPTEDPHRRLKPYKLFRLTRGTGLTTIAGNVFARRCFPASNAVCKPPHVK